MLKKRLIPKLQLRRVAFGASHRLVLVTTLGFRKSILIGDPVSQARIYQDVAADELILLDLDATKEGRPPNHEIAAKVSEQIFMPITMGGGVKDEADFHRLLNSGADKVAINSGALRNPEVISKAATIYGSQCVVVSIDFKKQNDGTYKVYSDGGTVSTKRDVLSWASEAADRGAGELLLTSIDRDGKRTGLEIDVIKQITRTVSIPVIASGGVGLASHFSEGFLSGGADAVSAGTFFCFKDENPMQARAQIRNAGVNIRIGR